MNLNKKSLVVVCIAVPVGLLHFVTGPDYGGPYPVFVNGYLIDILLPLVCYFLLCTRDYPVIGHWWVRGLVVLGVGVFVETAQYFEYPLLGETFDTWDYAAYGAGVIFAILLDQVIFTRLLPFWTPAPAESHPAETHP